MLILYEKKVSKGDYRLGRILSVLPDCHGLVRTVVVGVRAKERDRTAKYVPKPLEKIQLGIQCIAVIYPVEEQDLDAEDEHLDAEEQELDAKNQPLDTSNQDLDAEAQDLVAEERT